LQVSESCADEVRQHRQSFLSQTQLSRGKALDRPVTVSHQLTVDATRRLKSSSSSQQKTSSTRSSIETSSTRYLVTNYHCGGPLSAAFRKLQQDADLRLLPVVGTAMILDEDRTSDWTGRTFSYLPLLRDGSSNTGLPVHVNGAFALEANRKHVKWPSMIGSDRSRDEHLDKHLLWNQCLLREALPSAYCTMLLAAIQLHASAMNPPFSAKMIYHAFPDFSAVDRRWECVLPILYTELFKNAVVYTEAESGIWVEPRHAIFNTLSESEPELANIILAVLAAAGVKVADCPPHMLRAINRCCRFTLNEITPVVVAAAVKKVQYGGNSPLSWDSRLRLLRYFLQRTKYDLLDGLELLPLANGGFTEVRFNPRKADRPVYTAPTVDVFRLLLVAGSCLEDEFLDMDIDKDIRKMLLDAVKKGRSLALFTVLT